MTILQYGTPTTELIRVLPDLPATAQQQISRQLLRGLGLSRDFRDSIESGLTETFEEFCERLSTKAAGR